MDCVFWSGNVFSSLWSNVPKVTSVWDHSVGLWRLWLLVVTDRQTRCPIELFWTAKNKLKNNGGWGSMLMGGGDPNNKVQKNNKKQKNNGGWGRMLMGEESQTTKSKNKILNRKYGNCENRLIEAKHHQCFTNICIDLYSNHSFSSNWIAGSWNMLFLWPKLSYQLWRKSFQCAVFLFYPTA